MTKGEKIIRVDFNVSESTVVDELKTAFANLVDYIDALESADGRLKALAITKIEEAAMWAVKAATS